ncbi:MAG: FG-GAP-like repeat-containing protein [Planctomycetota bacterium]
MRDEICSTYKRGHLTLLPSIALMMTVYLMLSSPALGVELSWRSSNKYRVLLRVDPRGVSRSNSPASVEIDFVRVLSKKGISGIFDEHTIEVIAYDSSGSPKVFDASRDGYERYLLPWRLEKYYGANNVTLSFVMPDETCTTFAVYFDTIESGLGRRRRYRGVVGDGDFFREGYGRRETGAHHFDTFCDLDSDGDLDLFKGGVEPFIYCYENIGDNRFVDSGRLTSGGKLFMLPKNNNNNRSWVVPHFYDWDRDGDQDFFPSFMSGPYGGKIVFFENTTKSDGQLTFVDRGPLKTVSGVPVAGGKQAGGWFPSVVFVVDFDGDDDRLTDIILGNNNHCYLYRNLGADGSDGWRLDDAVTIQAGGEDIELFNPCFDVADIDNDGDWDLFGAPQAGEILLFENIDKTVSRTNPTFAKGVVIAHDDLYVQPSGHPRLKVADFTGDGLLDFVVDRAWELTDLNHPLKRDYGALFKNTGTATSPKWQRTDAYHGAAYTEEFQMCDAVRQNVVRAVDWNNDGKTDLIAGDCDGFVWYFRNQTNNLFPVFTEGRKLRSGGRPLSLANNNGHARHDICDWNNDGRKDLIASDGAGKVTVYLNEGTDTNPALGPGEKVKAHNEQGVLEPIDRGTRSHLMVCDWNNDGKKDIIFSDQENPGFYFFRNIGTDANPSFVAAKNIGLTPYMRPNLGSFVDWDEDGKKDLIACEFEHSIRFYKNISSGKPNAEPKFSDPDGIRIVKPYSIMMISGADAVDWNRDGDIDILTGQGHGGSGIRFYERDYIEDCINNTHPIVKVEEFETSKLSFLEVVRRYADAMIEHGRDTYGEKKSGLFLSALDRLKLKPLTVRPEPPGDIRRGDREGLPWLKLVGANPQVDQNLLRALYTLSKITADKRYSQVADHELEWFFKNTQSPVTGLLPWGEHMSWHVMLDKAISSGTDFTHEFARPWVLWDKSFKLAPEASKRFALGLWNHQIANQQTGGFDRHAPYDRHGPVDGKDFARHGGFYIHTWAYAYKHTKDETFLRAIEAVLARFERKQLDKNGVMHGTIGPLDVATAASMVPQPLTARLRKFAEIEDRLILEDLHKQYGRDDGTLTFKSTWQAGYSSGVTAGWAMFGLARYQQVKKKEFRDLVIAVADAYVDSLPDEDVDVWPMSFGHIISTQVAAYKFTGRAVYLEQACRFARMAVEIFWQDNPLPRASFKTGHYETITGADSLALALLEVHAALNNLVVAIPSNTIDR